MNGALKYRCYETCYNLLPFSAKVDLNINFTYETCWNIRLNFYFNSSLFNWYMGIHYANLLYLDLYQIRALCFYYKLENNYEKCMKKQDAQAILIIVVIMDVRRGM